MIFSCFSCEPRQEQTLIMPSTDHTCRQHQLIGNMASPSREIPKSSLLLNGIPGRWESVQWVAEGDSQLPGGASERHASEPCVPPLGYMWKLQFYYFRPKIPRPFFFFICLLICPFDFFYCHLNLRDRARNFRVQIASLFSFSIHYKYE